MSNVIYFIQLLYNILIIILYYFFEYSDGHINNYDAFQLTMIKVAPKMVLTE